MKKYVTINNKENTANILLLLIFPYTRSYFIVFDFTMNSLPIVVFYFCWKMLEDSLTFELSSLAPLKEKKNENLDPRKKERSAECKSMTLLALILKSSVYVLKIVKTKILKQKLWFLLYIPLLHLLIFHFHQLHFKNKILLRIANIYDDY